MFLWAYLGELPMSTTLKPLHYILAAAALGTFVTACNGKSSDRQVVSTDAAVALSPQQVRSEVQQAVKAYADAWNRADVSGVLELYAREPSVTSIGDGEITRGWESVRTETDSILTGLQGRFSVALGSIDVAPLGSQHALAVAPYTLTLGTQRGPVQVRGAMSFVLQRADSGWKIIHEHSSTIAESAK